MSTNESSFEPISKNQLLSINDSLKQTLGKLKNINEADEEELKLDTSDDKLAHLSLLSLKNDSMLSYIQSMAFLLLQESNQQLNIEDSDLETDDGVNEFEWNTIVQKTIIEKGIKPIEKKLQYQLDKLCKVYYNEHEKLQKEQIKAEKAQNRNSSDDEKSDNKDENDESSSDDEAMYKPNIQGEISAYRNRAAKLDAVADEEDVAEGEITKKDIVSGKYQPIKVTQNIQFEDKFDYSADKNAKKNKLQSMEEYIQEMQDKPEWESSIGANLQKSGKKSMSLKSQHTMSKDKELENYEETNFIRLNKNNLPGQNKKLQKRLSKQKEMRDRVNVIAGEDFSIFNNSGAQKRKFDGSVSRNNKKPKGAWERAKKRL
ncbi:hypothetical protein QEN19_003075 [Hanseniaspora menglaensis]